MKKITQIFFEGESPTLKLLAMAAKNFLVVELGWALSNTVKSIYVG